GLDQGFVPTPRGFAVQTRINLETTGPDGTSFPSSGTLTTFAPPTGPGVRVDTHAKPGHSDGDGFDPLLAKVVAHAPRADFPTAVDRPDRALGESTVVGPDISIAVLPAILHHPDCRPGPATTAFVDDHLPELLPSEE